MKYSEKNRPLVCMMTQSTCYKGTRKFTPKGVLWHSTGANNPWLKRYVQPDDNAADKSDWLKMLGKNAYANDWNHIDCQAGLNFWIGKLADGTVAAVQTMPWDYRPWGCGSGSKGSCNNTHIQFEICEDNLADKSYWDAVYKEACEMTAYLCKMFNIDPKGTTVCSGVTVPTIIDHIGSNALGLGSNHGDIQNWSRKYGKTMENVRNDVAAIMVSDDSASTTPAPTTPPAAIYRVRKTWADSKTQKGAYKLLANAKKCADANPGYCVFDADGKVVYPVAASTSAAFKVRVDIPNLNIRRGPGTDYARTGQYTGKGAFTIVEVQSGEGSEAGWGKLKSGAGWISLDYAARI